MQHQQPSQHLCLFNQVLASPVENQLVLFRRHRHVFRADPDFYIRLARWHARNGLVRAHNPVFAAFVFTADRQDHREVGRILLHSFSPKEVSDTLNRLQHMIGFIPRRFRGAVATVIQQWIDNGETKIYSWKNQQLIQSVIARLHLRPIDFPNPVSRQLLRPPARRELAAMTPERVVQNWDRLVSFGAFASKRTRNIVTAKWWQYFQLRGSSRFTEVSGEIPMIRRKTAFIADEAHREKSEVLFHALSQRMISADMIMSCSSTAASALDQLRQAKEPIEQLVILSTNPAVLRRLQAAHRSYCAQLNLAPEVILVAHNTHNIFQIDGHESLPWQIRTWQPGRPLENLQPIFQQSLRGLCNDIALSDPC